MGDLVNGSCHTLALKVHTLQTLHNKSSKSTTAASFMEGTTLLSRGSHYHLHSPCLCHLFHRGVREATLSFSFTLFNVITSAFQEALEWLWNVSHEP